MRIQGYETSIDYTYGYYRDLAPTLQRFALLSAGYEPPNIGRYLELGFGRGLSLNIHAAANPIEAFGTDFMPGHALQAQTLAKSSGAVALEDSFEELLARDELGEFDSIALHGIYTWVDVDRRREIQDIIRKRLKTGGTVAISYNSMPGWTPALALQRLFRLYADELSIPTDPVVQRMKEAVVLANKLAEDKSLFFEGNPGAKARLEMIAKQPILYVVHEYLHEGWSPLYFMDVVKDLDRCKVEFACSSNVLDVLEGTRLPAAHREFQNEIDSPIVREQMRDFWINAGFRKDIFARGLRRLSLVEKNQALMATRIVATMTQPVLEAKVKTAFGEIALQMDIFNPVIEALREAGRPMTIADIQAKTGQDMPKVVEAASILVGASAAHPAHDPEVTAKVKAKCAALNKQIRARAKHNSEILYLASPVTGGGMPVGRIDQMFISAIEAGKKTQAAWCQFTIDAFASVGQSLQAEGKAIEGVEAGMAHLAPMAKAFEEQRLPTYRALGLI